ncbi:MAG TPA: single-stranded DNA-binding protein [Anaerolineae bacterium]|nr:single-stranded DNA-binding protein [Anaerolineae bacterium]
MPALNRVQIIGRLGKDTEQRKTAKGTPYTVFSVAVDHRWKGKDGETHKETDWFNIEAWGKLGETCHKYLGKGRLVFVEGRLRTAQYEQEGVTRYFTKVVANKMQMLDWKEKEPEPAVMQEEEVEATEEK